MTAEQDKLLYRYTDYELADLLIKERKEIEQLKDEIKKLKKKISDMSWDIPSAPDGSQMNT